MIEDRLLIVVGSGGVGKTTLAAALGVAAAEAGQDTLVMTFDPSLRLKDALGVGEAARDAEIPVPLDTPGRLAVSLLDARRTFDRLVARYAPDEAARDRILTNRYYDHLAGSLAGVLEYMAVERLFEASREHPERRIILDTPPTRQALDFLEAPDRIISFLDSGALRIALKPWFDASGHLRPTSRLGPLGRGAEAFLDRIVGLELLRDMAEFFQAFAPLFDGFRARAAEVQSLLRSTSETGFLLVSGPNPERVADTLFFARKLGEAGYRLGPVAVNRVHPAIDDPPPGEAGRLLAWLGRRDQAGVGQLRELLGRQHPVAAIPLLPSEPTTLDHLSQLARLFYGALEGSSPVTT
ncbi:MAG TPA: ArsA family ATPase [Acidobacteria bacterium]|nr:ArsA family ATPase [Acidobacteriota bacterium]